MRRALIGLLILVAGAVSIAMTARYGWKQADNDVDQWFSAVMYGSIALFAICFDGLAVYFWFKGLRKTALFIGLIAGLAFVVTFSNSLGSIASRSDAVEASRQETTDARKDDREELKRLRAELVNLHYTPTNDQAVAAAKRLADTASENRRLECDKRGPNCRQRELDDAAAASALAAVTASKATTDRAHALESAIAALKKKIDMPTGVGQTNPLGHALSLLMGSAGDMVTARLQAIIALVFELCIVGLMVAFEALGHTSQPAIGSRMSVPAPAPLPARPTASFARPTNVLDLTPRKKALAPPTPVEDEEIDPTPLIHFIKERVPKAAGEEADWEEILHKLPEWWADKRIEGALPTTEQFVAILKFISDEAGIRTRKRGRKVYFVDRKVV